MIKLFFIGMLGFISLTLPVFLYFFLSEKTKGASFGKRIMNLSVYSRSKGAKPRILLRNILKFLPWEIAHSGVHWIVFYSKYENHMPIWVWTLLIFPQIIMVAYLVSIFFSQGEDTIYDRISNTRIKINQSSTTDTTYDGRTTS